MRDGMFYGAVVLCENAAYLSGSKLFLWLRQFTINKAKRWDEDVAKDMEDLIKK